MRMKSAVNQGRKDKNKLYSLHAPEMSCIAKGKAYALSSKISAVSVSNVGINMDSFKGNPHDKKTLVQALDSAYSKLWEKV